MNSVITLWNFSRPHTVIGSIISICTLFVIICQNNKSEHLSLLVLALMIGVTCNLFIVGLNQMSDVEIDRINKPYLPIPSGALNLKQAKIIVYTALIISLGLALYVSPYLFAIIALSNTIGWAYSMRPFFLKRHHLTAALSISIVRGIMINLGGFLVFNYLVNNTLDIPENVLILTVFIIVFSIAISWFKDLPDIEGDAKYKIKTFAITYSPRAALITGSVLVVAAYLFTIYLKFIFLISSDIPSFETKVLLYGHIFLFGLFVINSLSTRLQDRDSINKFYKRFWLFFFAEYVLYMLAYLA